MKNVASEGGAYFPLIQVKGHQSQGDNSPCPPCQNFQIEVSLKKDRSIISYAREQPKVRECHFTEAQASPSPGPLS